jgi:putative membrane protein
MKTIHALPVALAVACAFGLADAQVTGKPATTPNTGSSMTGGQASPAVQPGTGTRKAESNKDDQLSKADRKFIQDAAGDGMFEVEAGQLAASKAQSPDVKNFANKLVTDHQQANNELVQIANARKVELSAAPPRGKRHEIEKMGKKSGGDFDKSFLAQNIKDHEADIKKFEKAQGKVQDPELKGWIEKTLPHLREHLAMAQKLHGGNDSAAMGHRGAGKS